MTLVQKFYFFMLYSSYQNLRRNFLMKRKSWINKISQYAMGTMAALALLVTASNAASACWYVMGQDELPEEAKRLRKF